MRNKNIWSVPETEDRVLADWYGDGNKTVTFTEVCFPVPPWRIAQAMNNAFMAGYKAAQEDMREALGVKL